MKKGLLAFTLLLLTGCTMPATTVRSVDSRPGIAVKGAKATAELFIDNINYGKAENYNGDPQILIVEPGTHRVKIVDGNTVVYEQTIFVESELKTITVR